MQIRTHATLDRSLCGTPRSLTQDASDVELLCDARMQADERGLVHGGFLFGLADHAAMLAVNEPTVVLVEGTMQFSKPVVVGETVQAHARVERNEGKRRAVVVDVLRAGEVVARATFSCAVLSRHVLDRG